MKIESTAQQRQQALLRLRANAQRLAAQQEAERLRLAGLRKAKLERLAGGLVMSYVAYCDAPTGGQYLADQGFSDYIRVRKWFGAEGCCCIKDRQAYLAFTGTDSFFDVLVDLLGILPWYRPAVHSGFGGSWQALKNKSIADWLRTHAQDFDAIGLYGHSLGGAIAHVAALDLAADYTISEVITFGAPRSAFWSTPGIYNVTRSRGADRSLGQVTDRVVNGLDVIAKLPPAWMGYGHVGQMIYLSYSGEVWLDEEGHNVQQQETLSGILARLSQGLFPLPPAGHGLPLGGAEQFADLSWLARLWRGIGMADQVLPVIKPWLLSWIAIFLPLVTFLTGFGYLFVSSASHLTNQYLNFFDTDDIQQRLKPTSPKGIKIILGLPIKLVAVLAKAAIVVLAFYAIFWVLRWLLFNTIVPGAGHLMGFFA